MKLNYLDVLEQCFRNTIFGYNKEDVDTFLHLVAEDFKELYEELELLKIEIAKKDKDIERINEEASHKKEETKTKKKFPTFVFVPCLKKTNDCIHLLQPL